MKKATRILALTLVICTMLTFILPCSADDSPLELIAHRGYSSAAPENTLAAVKEAGKAGFYGCEFDIKLTKDGVWVVSHNNSLIAATDSAALICALKYDELKEIKITKGNGIENYPNERIPTLTEMLDECAKWGLHPFIEIKDLSLSAIPGLCELLNLRPEKDFFTVISFNYLQLKAVKEELPDMKCMLLTNLLSDADIELCTKCGIDGISFNSTAYSSDIAARAREKGLILNAWTVDDLQEARALYADSVTSITTNSLDPSYSDEITGGDPALSVIEQLMKYLKAVLDRILWLLKMN